MFSDDRYVMRAVKAGARGYLLKDSVEEDLLKAIRATHAGHSYFSPPIARTLLDGYARGLDSRECGRSLRAPDHARAADLPVAGRRPRQQGDRAACSGLSLHTVETHRVRIMEKMDVHSAAELVLSAVRRGSDLVIRRARMRDCARIAPIV